MHQSCKNVMKMRVHVQQLLPSATVVAERLFSQASVVLSTVGRGHAWQGGMHGRWCVWWGGGMRGRGRRAWLGGGGGMRGRRECHCSGRYASYWNSFLLKIIWLWLVVDTKLEDQNPH